MEHTRDEIAGGRTVGNAKDISKHLKTSQNNTCKFAALIVVKLIYLLVTMEMISVTVVNWLL